MFLLTPDRCIAHGVDLLARASPIILAGHLPALAQIETDAKPSLPAVLRELHVDTMRHLTKSIDEVSLLVWKSCFDRDLRNCVDRYPSRL